MSTFLLQENYNIGGHYIKIVRDDVFPFFCGGGKARKAVAYEVFLRENRYDSIVTCGGIQSNHNRAMSLLCAKNGWRCHICVQGDARRFQSEKGNAFLVRQSGAEYECIRPEDTSVAMERAMRQLMDDGFNPYYVNGGGHNLPGGTCFVDAVRELKQQCDLEGYKPDYIFLASGTGGTQAGIQVGLDLVGWADVKCVGISVARQHDKGVSVIEDFANSLANFYKLNIDYKGRILFSSDYLCGGYEKYCPEMIAFLDDVIKKSGLVFDTTYSGKGLWGMMKEIQRLQISNSNIIFWHTGGLLNYLK